MGRPCVSLNAVRRATGTTTKLRGGGWERAPNQPEAEERNGLMGTSLESPINIVFTRVVCVVRATDGCLHQRGDHHVYRFRRRSAKDLWIHNGAKHSRAKLDNTPTAKFRIIIESPFAEIRFYEFNLLPMDKDQKQSESYHIYMYKWIEWRSNLRSWVNVYCLGWDLLDTQFW